MRNDSILDALEQLQSQGHLLSNRNGTTFWNVPVQGVAYNQSTLRSDVPQYFSLNTQTPLSPNHFYHRGFATGRNMVPYHSGILVTVKKGTSQDKQVLVRRRTGMKRSHTYNRRHLEKG
jgi:hypothetical protein